MPQTTSAFSTISFDDIQEFTRVLRRCKAGERIVVGYSVPCYSAWYTAYSYDTYCNDDDTSLISEEGRIIGEQCEEFTVPSDGDWYLVLTPKEPQAVPPVITIERHPVDPARWNTIHFTKKIVRRQGTPVSTRMACTIGYWESQAGQHFPQVKACPVCDALITREEARCTLVGIVGEASPRHYVIPLCRHCHAHAAAFMADTKALAAAPLTHRLS